jgi:hypothetical protein
MVRKFTSEGYSYIDLPYTPEERERLERDWFSAPPRRILRGPRPRPQPEAERPDQGPQEGREDDREP